MYILDDNWGNLKIVVLQVKKTQVNGNNHEIYM